MVLFVINPIITDDMISAPVKCMIRSRLLRSDYKVYRPKILMQSTYLFQDRKIDDKDNFSTDLPLQLNSKHYDFRTKIPECVLLCVCLRSR